MWFYLAFVLVILAFYVSFFINLVSGWEYFSSAQFMRTWTVKNFVTVTIIFGVGGTLLYLMKKNAPAEY